MKMNDRASLYNKYSITGKLSHHLRVNSAQLFLDADFFKYKLATEIYDNTSLVFCGIMMQGGS